MSFERCGAFHIGGDSCTSEKGHPGGHTWGAGLSPKTALPRRMNGIERIASERQRQLDAEGWTLEHDDTHYPGELSDAAIAYALHPFNNDRYQRTVPPDIWPWEDEWWKPSPDDRIRELSKAGALIAAEIDRLERASAGSTERKA